MQRPERNPRNSLPEVRLQGPSCQVPREQGHLSHEGAHRLERNTGIIMALDVTGEAHAIEVAKAASPHIDAIKVNYPLVLSCGMEMVEKLSRIRPVICDFKVADIPNTNMLITREIARRGASGLICHTFPGTDSLRACIENFHGDVFAVTEMSHPGAKHFMQPLLEELVMLAMNAGASGIIAPATRPDRIRKARDLLGNRLILTPGVGAQGGSARNAMEAGADFLIVGRSIYGSPEPGAAAAGLAAEIVDLL